jgi:hypothetical protein
MVVTLSPRVGDASTTTERAESSLAGAAWLATQFTGDGFIPDINGDPDYSNTAQSTLALAAAASQEPTFRSAMSFLESHVDDYLAVGGVGAYGYLLLLAEAAGASPTSFGGHDLVAELEATLGDFEPGLYGAGDPTFDGAFRQGLALLGLAAAGVAPDPSAVDWLTDQQCGPTSPASSVGGWEAYRADTSVPCGLPDPNNFTGPDSNSTALALAGLAAVGVTPPNDAVAFLDATQESDGGWSYIVGVGTDPNSTAIVVLALLGVGEDLEAAPWVESGGSPWDSLRSWQLGDEADPADRGAFASLFSDGLPDQFATQQAVWGMAGRPFPLGAVQFGPDTPTPPTSAPTGSAPVGGAQPQAATRPQFTG